MHAIDKIVRRAKKNLRDEWILSAYEVMRYVLINQLDWMNTNADL